MDPPLRTNGSVKVRSTSFSCYCGYSCLFNNQYEPNNPPTTNLSFEDCLIQCFRGQNCMFTAYDTDQDCWLIDVPNYDTSISRSLIIMQRQDSKVRNAIHIDEKC